MSQLKPHEPATYQEILNLPENLIGEIINDTLVTQPRPIYPHAFASSLLGYKLMGKYQEGEGEKGGWWFINEPELHLREEGKKEQILVPDLAGWRVERMPRLPEIHYTEVIPDWICEVLSPSTARRDRKEKRDIYAEYGLKYFWLIDPKQKQLEVYHLSEDQLFVPIALFKGEAQVQAEPFPELVFPLKKLWM